MPKYQYEAMNAQGQEVKDEIEALSSEEAISKIRNLGFFPTKIREKSGRRPTKKSNAGVTTEAPRRPRGTGGGVNLKLLTQFTRQLSTLQDAGLPILRSLHILQEQQKPGTLKRVCGAVANEVESGATLSEGMAKFPRAFNNLYTNMVAAGEAGGVLDLILSRLADFMERAARLKRQIIGAMIYPICVMAIAFSIVMGIMVFVVPKFKTIFSDFGTELPGITQWLLNTSNWIMGGGWIIVLVTPFAVFIFFKLVRLSRIGRLILDKITMYIPVVGQLTSKTSIARFSRTLGTLIAAGVPILEALKITRETAGNEVYRNALGQVHESIRRGESFSEPLRKTRVCDNLVVNMIDVGKETGELDKMLMKIADNYDEEVSVLVESLVSLMEPLLIIMLGGICGTITVALYMPMIKLISSFSG